jgi:hypothetical protein
MKGFVFIPVVDTFVRFLATGAFEGLETQHDITYVSTLSPKNEKLAECLSGKPVEWIPFHPGRHNLWKDWFLFSSYHFRQRSPSFEIRVEETLAERADFLERLKQRDARFNVEYLALVKHTPLHPDLLALYLRHQPDFFVLPSSIMDAMAPDVLQLAHALDIPTLLLIVGWDNVSSKPSLFFKPTIMGVWGEQSIHHAVQVQNMPPERIHIIGAPHYEIFRAEAEASRNTLRGQWGVPPDQNLILFGGSSRGLDETEVLHEIEQAIELGHVPDAHILYRPHPLRGGRRQERSFFEISWRHVTMDPSMVEVYQERYQSSRRTPNPLYDLTHLRDIYRAVDAVITPMSTVLLEAMLHGLPVLSVAFAAGNNPWNADASARLLHLKDMLDVPEVLLCRDRGLLLSNIRQLISNVADSDLRHRLRQSAAFFVAFPTETTYAERVVALVDRMMEDVKQQTPRRRGFAAKMVIWHRIGNEWHYGTRFRRLRAALGRIKRLVTRLRIEQPDSSSVVTPVEPGR